MMSREMLVRAVFIVLALIIACVRSDQGHKKTNIISLRENITALWEVIGQLQAQVERLEQEEHGVHHHHHHYHHRYYLASTNETLEDVNGTLVDLKSITDHEISYEREIVPLEGEHHHHHHYVNHYINDEKENETESNEPKRCPGVGNGNGNGNGNFVDDDSEEALAKAVCQVRPNRALPANQRQNIRGSVYFRQTEKGLTIILDLKGFLMTPQHVPEHYEQQDNGHVHALHVHEFGDLSNGCESAGGHYNPLGSKRHVGDFGKVECDSQGKLQKKMTDDSASLSGEHSIIGKTLVIHENNNDDSTSQSNGESSATNGNNGRRLACCVITKQDE